MVTLDDLRRYAVGRSLFPPIALNQALATLGFVQADPIRAPARAQDLILRHRVLDYRAGDLDRNFSALQVEEDFFINYGFVTRSVQALMHPRTTAKRGPWSFPVTRKRTQLLLDFILQRGAVHPREVDNHFAHGSVTNYWGGSSNATTHMLDSMHYRGLLRVVRREAGIRIYGVHSHGPAPADAAERRRRLDALADVAIQVYAPLPARSLSIVLRRLRYAAPHLEAEIKGTLARARERLAHVRIDATDWYWPAAEDPKSFAAPEKVRLLAPFDPVVWDRDRFEMLWGWKYRLEAYTPPPKRKLGYYALPLLWRDQVLGWANVSATKGTEIGYQTQPKDRSFKRELTVERASLKTFLTPRQ